MVKLLRAGFWRMWRSKLLYLGTLAVAINSLSVLANNWYYKTLWDLPMGSENLVFSGTWYIGLCIAIFCVFFVGSGYDDGGFRNKIVSGASKAEVFFAELTVTSVAALLMLCAGSGAVFAVGVLLLGSAGQTAGFWLVQVGCCLLSVVALNALLCLVSMSIPFKAVGVVAAIVVALVVAHVLPVALYDKLSEPPMIDGGGYLDDLGVYHEFPDYANPDYVEGFSRTLLEFCYDTLPTGQIDQYDCEKLPERLWRFPLCSLLFLASVSGLGSVAFARRDLK